MTDPDDLIYGPLDDETPVVDEVAIERALRGWRVELNKPERVEFIRRGAAEGVSDVALARSLGMCAKHVSRLRNKHDIRATPAPYVPATQPALGRWLKESA